MLTYSIDRILPHNKKDWMDVIAPLKPINSSQLGITKYFSITFIFDENAAQIVKFTRVDELTNQQYFNF